jgi:hypothetical protein
VRWQLSSSGSARIPPPRRRRRRRRRRHDCGGAGREGATRRRGRRGVGPGGRRAARCSFACACSRCGGGSPNRVGRAEVLRARRGPAFADRRRAACRWSRRARRTSARARAAPSSRWTPPRATASTAAATSPYLALDRLRAAPHPHPSAAAAGEPAAARGLCVCFSVGRAQREKHSGDHASTVGGSPFQNQKLFLSLALSRAARRKPRLLPPL